MNLPGHKAHLESTLYGLGFGFGLAILFSRIGANGVIPIAFPRSGKSSAGEEHTSGSMRSILESKQWLPSITRYAP
jgi:hypothetical protein